MYYNKNGGCTKNWDKMGLKEGVLQLVLDDSVNV